MSDVADQLEARLRAVEGKLDETLRLAKHQRADIKALEKLVRQFVGGTTAGGVQPSDLMLLNSLTPKMHVALQMMLAGRGNREIAEVLGVAENTAKVHVRNVMAKMDVNTRSQVVAKMLSVMKGVASDTYEETSNGLPKDWAERVLAGEEDQWQQIYRD